MQADNESTLEGFAGPAGGALSPGAMLQAARVAKGLSVAQLSESLHLDTHMLEALEADRFDAFDAPVYARGFLRKAAGFLGLEPELLLEGYDRVRRSPVTPTLIPAASARIVPRDLKIWYLPLGGIAVAVVIAVSIWWLIAGLPGVSAVSSFVGRVSATAPVAAPASGTTSVPLDDTSTSAGPPEPQPELGGAAAEPMEAQGGADLATPPAVRGELALQLSGPSWVDVTGPDGRHLQVGMVDRGTLRFSGTGPWRVLLGDQRQVKVFVGGSEIRLPPSLSGEDFVSRFAIGADGVMR